MKKLILCADHFVLVCKGVSVYWNTLNAFLFFSACENLLLLICFLIKCLLSAYRLCVFTGECPSQTHAMSLLGGGYACRSDCILTTLIKRWLCLLNSHDMMTIWREDENWKKDLDVENRSLGMCPGQAVVYFLTSFCCSLATTAHTFLPPWYSALPMRKQRIQLSQAWDLWDYEFI